MTENNLSKMSHDDLKDYLCRNFGEGVAVLEPEYFDDAIVGTSEEGRLIYSYDKLVEVVAENEGMTYEEATEWVDYNTVRAIPYMGELSPIVVYSIDDLEGDL